MEYVGTLKFVSRRRWILLGGLVVLSGCASVRTAAPDGAGPDRRKVRRDVEPLQRRFAAVGQLSDPHWLGYNPNDLGRESIPDQDPHIRVVGVARLPAGTVNSIVSVTGYAFEPSAPSQLPEELAEFLPENAEWVSSASYDNHITNSLYPGRFHLAPATDWVYFDTVNPEVVDGSHPQ
ncbi:hypothetical protein ACFV6F_34025 [Kitasatospora phosalacinea]|uniref:hypothetical protein n=1 Tax=Kitasatospora phosalacinea TaxID=2065 RepID=UPI003649AC12